MKSILLRLVALGVVLCTFTGCATTNDSTRTEAEGTGFGALLGAAVGAGIGGLVGGKNGALIGAGVGAAVGAGTGYIVGGTVAERKKKYANEEDRLDGEINVVANYNIELNKYNKQTAQRVGKLDLEIIDLRLRIDNGSAEVDALKNKHSELNVIIKDNNKRKTAMINEFVALNAYLHELKKANEEQVKVAKLDQEISLLKKNITLLDISNIQLAQLVTKTTVRR